MADNFNEPKETALYDVAEVEEIRNRLKTALGVIETYEKNRTDYLSRMSHELCTPMNTIMSMSHIAAETDDIEKIKSCVSTISASTALLLDMINDILDMSRIEFGLIKLVKLPFDLAVMLAKACETVFQNTFGKKLCISFDIEEGAPTKVRGDEFRSSQIIIKLLKGVIRFAPDMGEIAISVRIAERTPGKASFRFGIVIAFPGGQKDDQKQLLSTLVELEGGESKHYGEASLGLAIAKAFIEMMDGRIWTEDIPGGGRALYFTVLLEMLEPEEGIAAAAGNEGPIFKGVFKGAEPGELVSGKEYNEYEELLPYIDVKEGLANIGGNKKLFATMLEKFNDSVVFADLKKSIDENNMIKILQDYSALKNIAKSLSLVNLSKILVLSENQIENQSMQKSILLEIGESLMITRDVINTLLSRWDWRG